MLSADANLGPLFPFSIRRIPQLLPSLAPAVRSEETLASIARENQNDAHPLTTVRCGVGAAFVQLV